MATHLRAGQIKVVWAGPRTVIITVEVWTNTKNTTVLFGGDQDILEFGDGEWMLIPEQQNQTVGPSGLPLPEGVAYSSYTVRYEYDSPGNYIISYREPNRNQGVLNMDNSVNTTFYLETQIIIDPFFGPNSSPVLAIDPIDRACPGVKFTHNPGAHDPDPGDSISYSMEVPFSDRRTQVINYRPPNAQSFYLDYDNAQEDGIGTPIFNINQVTGTITFDAPGAIGEYNIAFHVIEWRKVNGTWRRLGYVRRDMQILVEDCDNERPVLVMPPDTCVVAGTKLNVDIIGKDADGDDVKIEAFSQIFDSRVFNPAAFIVPDPDADDWVPVDATTVFEWQTECENVKEQPYAVIFKITDNPPLGPRLVTYETWFITVVGPKPVWNNFTTDDTRRHVTVNWNGYECTNAETMQVWRKVDGSEFEPGNCETGMPENLGYELVGTVPIGTNSFTDTNNGAGLVVGAQYCYRLVAIFPTSTGGESLVSQDLCIDPFDLVVPVITNVDIQETSETNGTIRVAWVGPLDHPSYPNITYRVYRHTGFTRANDSTLAGETTDLFFVDNSLNTQDLVYNYSVAAYPTSNTSTLIGTSAVASTVRLETASRLRRIELDWSAVVPWSNNITGLTHKVYRGDEGATNIGDLTLLTDVDVSARGFVYVDDGLEQRPYCYLVETYGSYGNPLIPTPLINRSQIICTEPGDDVPPCKPAPPILAEGRDCQDYINTTSTCRTNDFTNKLSWTEADEDCNNDIDFYRIFWTSSPGVDYKFLADVRGTEYEDKGLNAAGIPIRSSYAACYKIAAVDRSGNISELSDPICFENCPYYELPNVFSPNGDGCNDYFSAYSDRDIVGETPVNTPCAEIPLEIKEKCARFVEKVVFRVYNRWGREVYSYIGASNDDDNGIYIDWDGKSSEGQPLSSGVYYYIAEVTFIGIDPNIKFKTLKGWVHLLREENK